MINGEEQWGTVVTVVYGEVQYCHDDEWSVTINYDDSKAVKGQNHYFDS